MEFIPTEIISIPLSSFHFGLRMSFIAWDNSIVCPGRALYLIPSADILANAIEETVGNKIVTYDLARQMDNVRPVRCSEYGEVIKKRIEQRA